MIGGTSPTRRNVTTPLTSSLAGGPDLPRVDIARLRATWLCEVAERIGLRAFMDAAGITCSQRLGDLVAALAVPDCARRRRALGDPAMRRVDLARAEALVDTPAMTAEIARNRCPPDRGQT